MKNIRGIVQICSDYINFNDLIKLKETGNCSNCNLENADLGGMNLRGANLEGSTLKGSILIDLSKNNEAETEFLKAIKLNPNYGGAYYNLGYLNGEIGNHSKSINYYGKAVQFDFELRIASPKGYEPNKNILQWARKNHGNILLTKERKQTNFLILWSIAHCGRGVPQNK